MPNDEDIKAMLEQVAQNTNLIEGDYLWLRLFPSVSEYSKYVKDFDIVQLPLPFNIDPKHFTRGWKVDDQT